MKRLAIAILSALALSLVIGGAFDAPASAETMAEADAAATVPVYRLYNETTREHLLTLDENERAVNVGRGWKDEGIAWEAPESSDAPVWRLYNESSHEHLYTRDANEYRVQVGNGWKDEGTAWYSADESGVPVYRLFNPYEAEIASHLYTQDANEYHTLGEQGWNQENVAWYGVAADSPATPDEPSQPDEPAQPDEPEGGAKVLVAYFSCTNTTKGIAEAIADAIPATLFRIEPQDPYTEADLDYYSGGRADQEHSDPTARPAIANTVDDMGDYDVIFLGYPIWYGEAPRIISTFLEGYDLAGKTIVPFCTSGSSPIGSSATNLHELAPDATWLDGRRFGAGTPASEVAGWVEGLDLPVDGGGEPAEPQAAVALPAEGDR